VVRQGRHAGIQSSVGEELSASGALLLLPRHGNLGHNVRIDYVRSPVSLQVE
jgi:hypothetical protein